MGCCLISLFGALWPRLVLIAVYFFAPAIPARAFTTTLWPILGFFFLPTTTLAYELCVYYADAPIEKSIWTLLIVILAFLHDLGQIGMARRKKQNP